MTIFHPAFSVAGVCVGAHRTFGHIVAIEFAAAFAADAAGVARRLESGPPPASEETAAARASGSQWDLGSCRGCTAAIEGGRVVEVAALGKWHEQCFACASCGTSLVGVKDKKTEKARVFCAACWLRLYALACAVCGEKIGGDRVGNGASFRHPSCTPASKARHDEAVPVFAPLIGKPGKPGPAAKPAAKGGNVPLKGGSGKGPTSTAGTTRTATTAKGTAPAARVGAKAVAALYKGMEQL